MNDISEVMAIILAGGKGTRLRPLTAVFPKPLVPLGDRPILEILLNRLAKFGFIKVTLCTGYLAEMIQLVCGDGSKFGLSINYSREDKPLGTVGPLSLLNDLSDPVIVMNGDLLTTLRFDMMLEFHEKQGADITIAAFERDVKIDFGVIQTDGSGNFKGFQEKPTFHFEVSMGVNVLTKQVLETIPKGKYMDMPDLISNVHQQGGKVVCYREPGCFWLDIGRMDDYALAQKEFQKNRQMFLEL